MLLKELKYYWFNFTTSVYGHYHRGHVIAIQQLRLHLTITKYEGVAVFVGGNIKMHLMQLWFSSQNLILVVRTQALSVLASKTPTHYKFCLLFQSDSQSPLKINTVKKVLLIRPWKRHWTYLIQSQLGIMMSRYFQVLLWSRILLSEISCWPITIKTSWLSLLCNSFKASPQTHQPNKTRKHLWNSGHDKYNLSFCFSRYFDLGSLSWPRYTIRYIDFTFLFFFRFSLECN